jgi:ubiquinone/menaquinone biosynthesis C-methylase UbiE
MIWILAIVILVIIGYILDREIYFYEGVHLGPRLQAWLYDRWAKKYDEGKRESQLHDQEMLAGPLVEALGDVLEPFTLDFATGTGRLAYALLNHPDFKGHVVALDLSQGMLEQAAAKLSLRQPEQHGDWQGGSVEFLRHPALPLPFPDQAFDAVCALEVLELFPGMDEPLRELARVLRPGGVLLTSRGTEESGRRARVKPEGEFRSLLERLGLEQVQITRWWKLFDRVIARKRGVSQPLGSRRLEDVLQCANCRSIRWTKTSTQWICQSCGREVSVTRESIVLN